MLLALGLLEWCGRKGTQAITYLVAAVGAIVLGLAAGVTVGHDTYAGTRMRE